MSIETAPRPVEANYTAHTFESFAEDDSVDVVRLAEIYNGIGIATDVEPIAPARPYGGNGDGEGMAEPLAYLRTGQGNVFAVLRRSDDKTHEVSYELSNAYADLELAPGSVDIRSDQPHVVSQSSVRPYNREIDGRRNRSFGIRLWPSRFGESKGIIKIDNYDHSGITVLRHEDSKKAEPNEQPVGERPTETRPENLRRLAGNRVAGVLRRINLVRKD